MPSIDAAISIAETQPSTPKARPYVLWLNRRGAFFQPLVPRTSTALGNSPCAATQQRRDSRHSSTPTLAPIARVEHPACARALFHDPYALTRMFMSTRGLRARNSSRLG